MIDDTILVDCPIGLTKKLIMEDVDFGKIRVIVISHFHCDHDFDLGFLLNYFRGRGEKDITIIAPAGFENRYKPMMDSLFLGVTGSDGNPLVSYEGIINKVNPNIIVAENNKITEANGYKITALEMDHFPETCDCYGYRIERDGKIAAFTGDSQPNPNIDVLVAGADIAFIDVTGPVPSGEEIKAHFDVPDFKGLRVKHPTVNLVSVHMTDSTRGKLKELGYNPPNDGDVIEV